MTRWRRLLLPVVVVLTCLTLAGVVLFAIRDRIGVGADVSTNCEAIRELETALSAIFIFLERAGPGIGLEGPEAQAFIAFAKARLAQARCSA